MQNQLHPIIIEPEKNANYSIIWLHGLGADGHDFVPIVSELNINQFNIRYVFPNAPIQPVTINNGIPMPSWYDIRGMDIADKEDSVGMQASSSYLKELINQEIEQGISSENILIAGFSQGGAVALYTLLRYPARLAGCMALSTYLPFMANSKSELEKTSLPTPVFWGHGTEDTVVPLDLGETSKEHLLDLGFSVEAHTYDMPHSVCHQEIQDIRTWIINCFA